MIDRWLYESDGDGPKHDRGDHYLVSEDGLERIATFHGPDARENAKRAARLTLTERNHAAMASTFDPDGTKTAALERRR